jgi:16S rRNA processing protein RimM
MDDVRADQPPADDVVLIGRIGAAHGVRGEVFVQPFTDDPDDRFQPGAVVLTEAGAGPPMTVETLRWHSGKLVLRFVGAQQRSDAEAIRGRELFLRTSDRPALDDPDDFYDTDLIGLTVSDRTGHAWGPVVDVVHAPGSDYLVLQVGDQQRLVPFVAAIVTSVDVAAGAVTIDPPAGLFEL